MTQLPSLKLIPYKHDSSMIHVGTKLKDSPKIGQFPWALESAYVMQRVHIMGSLWCLRRLRRKSDPLDHVSRLWSSPVEFFVPILNANSVDIWQSKHQRRIRSYETWMEIDKVSALSRIFEKYFTLNLFRFLRFYCQSEFDIFFSFGYYDEKTAHTRFWLYQEGFQIDAFNSI